MNTENKNTISLALREKTGKTIYKLAKELNLSRNALYSAFDGAGSRSTRVKIAALLNTKPSTLWRKNDRVTRACDDVCYRDYINEVIRAKNGVNGAKK